MTVFDIEVATKPEEYILANMEPWSEEEARTRVPKNYKKDEAINGWLEDDKANHIKNTLDRAALLPEFSEVAVVPFWVDGEIDLLVVGGEDGEGPVDVTRLQFSSEGDLIQQVWRDLDSRDASSRPMFSPNFTGWNILGYDLPTLVRRSWILGIDVPRSVFNPLNARYPYPDRFVDMMAAYSAGRFEDKRTSLDSALKAMGLPPKNGDGKDFPKLWREDRRKALEYAANDVLVTALLGQRMGVIPIPKAEKPSWNEVERLLTANETEDALP